MQKALILLSIANILTTIILIIYTNKVEKMKDTLDTHYSIALSIMTMLHKKFGVTIKDIKDNYDEYMEKEIYFDGYKDDEK